MFLCVEALWNTFEHCLLLAKSDAEYLIILAFFEEWISTNSELRACEISGLIDANVR